MKRIGVLTAGGDTPAINATLSGIVTRANQCKIEVFGLIKGFNSLFNPRVPYVHLNPLFTEIPELDATYGGTIIGASRDYIDAEDKASHAIIADRLQQLKIEGLICIGGDGTLNGMQPLTEYIPTVLAPKTIDNDLGLNYRDEPNEWKRNPTDETKILVKDNYEKQSSHINFDLERMINYVTPGYATSLFISTLGIQRIRTTAESHRRIAIVEVMGRHSGYIALGSAYGQPDIILIPEYPIKMDILVERIKEIYELQKNVVIVCGEGVVDSNGHALGDQIRTTDPAGNIVLKGAAESLRTMLIDYIEDSYFQKNRRGSAAEVIFTRKVGHVQRGGSPLLFDRFYSIQLGGKAVDMLIARENNAVAILQWSCEQGFYVSHCSANTFRDRWGHIHPRMIHPSFYNPEKMHISEKGSEYLLPICTNAIGYDDVENIRRSLFDQGNLFKPYHSVNTDIDKRIRYMSTTPR